FGNQGVNTTSAAQTVTLTNNTGAAVTVSQINTSGDFSQSNPCIGLLANGGSCNIAVKFTPTATGLWSGGLTVSASVATSPASVALSGTGVGSLTLSPASVNFGNQGVNTTSAAQTVTLTNNTGAAVTVSQINTSGDFSQSNPCIGLLANGGSCNIAVKFTPTATGLWRGGLTVSASMATSPASVALSGTGVGRLTLSPASVYFGNQ